MLNTAVKAARKAGSIITRASFDLDKLTIHRKQENDFVSEVDHAAEEAIISVLKEAYPDHGFQIAADHLQITTVRPPICGTDFSWKSGCAVR